MREKGDLIGMGTAYLPTKEIKGEFYVKTSDFSNVMSNLSEENKSLKESLDIATKCSSKEEDGIIRLSEENKKLKEKLKRKEGIIANLRDDIQTLELWLDNKEKLNEEYRKQLDKYKAQYEHSMGDDELIYEEGLY